MLYFPDYDGAEDKIYTVYEEWLSKTNLRNVILVLKRTIFPAAHFDLNSKEIGPKSCLVFEDWLSENEDNHGWLFHPEIFAIGHVWGRPTCTHVVYHPNWSTRQLIRDVSNLSYCDDEDEAYRSEFVNVLALGLHLMKGESALDSMRMYSNPAIENVVTNESLTQHIQEAVGFIVANFRDLDLKDPSVQVEILRRLSLCVNLISYWEGKAREVPRPAWEQIHVLLQILPQICASFASITVNSLKDKTTLATLSPDFQPLNLCAKDLDSLVYFYKRFAI